MKLHSNSFPLQYGRTSHIFAQKVKGHAGTDFYRNLATAMQIFIAEDIEEIANIELPEPVDHEY